MALSHSRRAAAGWLGLGTHDTLFFACDMQERFRSLILDWDATLHTATTLCKAANLLNCPVITTEQYPKAFGHTEVAVAELQPFMRSDTHPAGSAVFEKKLFSMITPEVEAYLKSKHDNYTTVVLFGIEAHVCVQQTCLDLLHKYDKQVYVVTDGVSSQRADDRAAALHLMSSSGAVLTTLESMLFMLCRSAEHPEFKNISKLVIEHNRTKPARSASAAAAAAVGTGDSSRL